MIMKELLAVMCRREEVVYKEIVYERVNAVIRRMTDNNTLKTYVEFLETNKTSHVKAPPIQLKRKQKQKTLGVNSLLVLDSTFMIRVRQNIENNS